MLCSSSEILSSYPRSGSPRRSKGGVCCRPQYPDPQSSVKSVFSASVELPAETSLASGLLLRGRVTESFNLFSGEVVQPADYVQDLLLYRAPCLSGAGAGRIAPPLDDGLRTTFPVTPSHQYTLAELLQGEVGVSIVPPEVQPSGVLAGPEGALLLSSDGIGLNLPAGALEKTVPVQLQSLAATAVTPLIPSGFTLVQALRIDLSRQTLQAGALLSLPLPAGFDASRPVVLAQLFAAGGGERLRGVAWLRPVGSLLTSVNSVGGVVLPGIRSGGTYCVLQSATPLGLVRGIVRNASNQPFGAALVTTASPGLADLSTASGSYLLFTAIGAVEVSALDLSRFDRGASSGNLPAGESVLSLDPVIRPTVPSVVTLSPSNGATGVEPTTRISLTFSEPIERSSISSASIALSSSDNTPVAGVFSFSPDATVVSFYPETRLISEGHYRLDITNSVRDLQGYTLAAPLTATFIVRDTTPPPLPPAGSITATFPDEEGMITVTATRGSAEYDATVLIINDTSGEIVSIAPHSDGSFSARIHGQLGDEIQVVLMDGAGNQTLISYLTFSAEDGRTLVTAKGGKVAGEGGLLLELPEGALIGPAVIKIIPVAQAALPHPVPAEAHFIGAVSIDSGGLSFSKEVELSIPLPNDLPANAFPFLAQPVTHVNADGSEERVYQIIDTVKIVNGRLTTASPPFDGVMAPGIYIFAVFIDLVPAIVSGTTYQDMNSDGVYTPEVDRPVSRAVIRSPGMWNFLSYSGKNGFYAALTDLTERRDYTISAIHPLTQLKKTAVGALTTAQNLIQNLNFLLADLFTTYPDKTPPLIELKVAVAPEQGPEARFVAGTVPVGTELSVTVAVVDQLMGAATLGIDFATPGMNEAANLGVQLTQEGEGSAGLDDKTLRRYLYQPTFNTPVKGSQPYFFRPNEPGVYRFTVEATDSVGTPNSRTLQVRAVLPGTDFGASVEGAPGVDEILPSIGASAIMVNTLITVAFSEPVDAETVTSATCYLLDRVTGQPVPAFIATSLENGRVVATLTPKGNLYYGREYEVVVTRGILDATENKDFGNVKLPLTREVRSRFTTKQPTAYDLASADQFAGGFDLALYTDAESGRTLAYVTAMENGWRVIDVTDPQAPRLVEIHNQTNTGVSWSERGVAVEQEVGTLALTEDIRYLGGGQYGYVRFHDLGATPDKPVRAGQEKLAEAFSGIPGRVALQGQYAFVATVGAGLQVVDIAAAQAHIGASDGSTIVGTFDCEGPGYGAAADILLYRWNRALLTTNGGYLLILDVSTPQLPQLLTAYKPGGFSAGRVAAVADFGYADAEGYPLSLDLGVTVGRDGRLRTLDLSDPYAPQVLGVAVDESGAEVITVAMDLAINKSAGLAFVTTFSSVQIFDLRNPSRPRLLSTLTQLPGSDGEMQLLGAIPAIVEKDGWVYLTDQTRGLRVLDVDAVAIQVTPTHLFLDRDGRPQTGQQLSYTISPTQYQANKSEVVVYKDNEVFKAFPAKTQGGGTVDLAAELFPLPGSYYAQVVLNRSTPAELRSARVAFIPQAVLIPDYNHDQKIDTTDYRRAAKGDSFYFWINDDDDEGETEGNDIPLPLVSSGESRRDADNNRVDGVRDLIDFFPVALDVKALVGVFPPNVYKYRLKSAAENLKVVFPQLTAATVKNYLVDVDTAKEIALKPAFPVPTNEWPSDGAYNIEARRGLDALLASAVDQGAPPVILLEGVRPGTAPLVLEIVDVTGNQVFVTSLNLSLDGVEQMYRHKNLIKVLSEHSEYRLSGHDPVPENEGMSDRLAMTDFTNPKHFAGFDADSDVNNFIHVHGYNVNGQAARGEQSEAFKRLYWSGSKARFCGVTWYSWESQWSSLERTPNYHVNVRHAFNTGRLLKNFVNQNVAGNVTVFAHSLGNMVVSAAIEEGMTVAHYLMVNAAVAEEAYTPQEAYAGEAAYESGGPWRNATREQMYHPAWRYPGGIVVPFEQAYQPQLWASEWYKLFAPDDGRSTLTWRNRFGKVRDLTDTFVYYAPTDEAFRPFLYTVEMAADNAGYQPNATDWPGVEELFQNAFNPNNPLGAYAFALQELLKGRMVLGDEDSDSGGWGFNLADDYYWQVKNTNIVPIDSAAANAIKKDQLKTRPFFLKNPDFGFLYNDPPLLVSTPLRDELLANEIPALTFAAGHRGVEKIKVKGSDRVIDIRQTFAVDKPWPQDRLNGYEWKHSDIYIVAYPYLSGLYDEWAKRIKGE